MPKKAAELSAKKVASIKSPGMYAVGGVDGLYLQIAGGGRSWILRYKFGERRRDLGIGSTGDYSLSEAREAARKYRKQVAEGIDPIDARQAKKAAAKVDAAKAVSFQQCAERYITAHQAGWRSAKHRQQWDNTLAQYAFPMLGNLPVAAVDTTLVVQVIEPLWATKAETASRLRGRIESILDWAKVRGYRQGENPARWRGHLDKMLPKKAKVRPVVHHAALPYAEIAAFVTALRQQESVAARVFEFMILTATRSGEARGARWDEIDLKAGLWTIPGARMKAGKEHRVPLSDAAMAIVEQMAAIRCNDFVFAGMRPNTCVAERTIPALLERMSRRDLTAHGFRSTFSDWVAERTAFPSEVREMALAHSVGSAVEQAYRRSDLFEKRRQLAEAWARYCAAPPATADNVVDLTARA